MKPGNEARTSSLKGNEDGDRVDGGEEGKKRNLNREEVSRVQPPDGHSTNLVDHQFRGIQAQMAEDAPREREKNGET
jgi:hypothetical protein